MPVRPAAFQEDLLILREEERPWGFLVHALGWVPIWGFVICAMIWLYFKNRSRAVVFHVQQAIHFHIIVLAPLIAWSVVSLVAGVISVLNERLGAIIQTGNTWLLVTCLTVLAGAGILGGALVYAGKPFLYPYFGQRVLADSIRKISED